MADPVDLKTFLAGFLAEAEEHIAASNRNLLLADEQLKKGQLPARAVRDLFRSLHTLKGLAGMVGVEPIVDLSHHMETVLREADKAGGRLAHDALDLLFAGVRAIEERVRALSRGEQAARAPADLLSRLEAVHSPPASRPPAAAPVVDPALLQRLNASEREQLSQALSGGLQLVTLEFRPSAERMAQGLTITSVRERVAELGEIIKVVPRSSPSGVAFLLLVATTRSPAEVASATRLDEADARLVQTAQPAEPTVPAAAPPTRADAPELADVPEPLAADEGALRSGHIRIDVARLDEAMDKLSALVVTRHRLQRAAADLAARGVNVRDLNAVLVENARQLRDLRSAIMAARMVPLRDVLERVPLMVRGLLRESGKRVRLQMDLGRLEVDKAVGDRIFPAIVHLVRNAIDHGIELPERRKASGKPEEARLTVSGESRGQSHLVIRVSDDGSGVDADAVAARAGVPTPKDAEALLELLARPGLSTRVQADRTSGRGMGIDSVRRVVVEELGGELTLETRRGEATTFTLAVPLSVTIIEAFTFTTGAQHFAVPVSAVEEIIEVDPTRLVTTPGASANAARLLRHRDGALPLFELAALFGRRQGDGDARKALVVRRQAEAFAFGVQRMLGQQEIVVRPLEDPLIKVPGVAGATDLGDGRATLVLDLQALSASLHAGRRSVG